MYVLKTNHYHFDNEERENLRQTHDIFDKLSDNLLYSADDYYELDNFNLSQDDIELIRNALSALVEASDIVTHDNVMTAD